MEQTLKFCPHCGSRDITKHSRSFRTEKSNMFSKQNKSVLQKLYRCNECKKQFDNIDVYNFEYGDLKTLKTQRARKVVINRLKNISEQKMLFGNIHI